MNFHSCSVLQVVPYLAEALLFCSLLNVSQPCPKNSVWSKIFWETSLLTCIIPHCYNSYYCVFYMPTRGFAVAWCLQYKSSILASYFFLFLLLDRAENWEGEGGQGTEGTRRVLGSWFYPLLIPKLWVIENFKPIKRKLLRNSWLAFFLLFLQSLKPIQYYFEANSRDSISSISMSVRV